jgi:uncharacterized protein (TIGR02452 family)
MTSSRQLSLDGFFSRDRNDRDQDTRTNNPSYRGSHRGRGNQNSRGNSTHRGRRPFNKSSQAIKRKDDLRAVAKETKDILPEILSEIPQFDAVSSTLYELEDLAPLKKENCPGLELPADDPEAGRKGTRIRVYNQDTFDAALDLQPDITVHSVIPQKTIDSTSSDNTQNDTVMAEASSSNDSHDPSNNEPPDEQKPHNPIPLPPIKKPVAVLNLASPTHPGGGFHNGALAQEEALCYRSSLYLSLHTTHYPLPPLSALYTPHVVLIRSALSQGHTLLFPATPARDLPATSVITLAGLKHPKLTNDNKYTDPADEDTTRDKIRISLRVAAHQGHTKLVLGALGCGVFGNPAKEVARLFLDVLCEEEFRGGWWSDVVFAVMDNGKRGEKGRTNGDGNYGVFWRSLDGRVV